MICNSKSQESDIHFEYNIRKQIIVLNLDRILQLDFEPDHICLLQPGLSQGFPQDLETLLVCVRSQEVVEVLA